MSEQNRLMEAIQVQHHLGESLTVKFGAYIQPDGEIAYVTIEKYDQRITLTPPQAKSLMKELERRIHD